MKLITSLSVFTLLTLASCTPSSPAADSGSDAAPPPPPPVMADGASVDASAPPVPVFEDASITMVPMPKLVKHDAGK